MSLASTPKRPNTIHHQKRHGLHQKRSDRFVKTYWPYLPLMCFVGVGVIVLGALIIGPLGAILGGASVTVGTIAILI